MPRLSRLLLVALLGLGGACARPRLDQRQALAWIDSKKAPASMDVSGAWESTSAYMAGGWGYAHWFQQGARVNGTLGPFTVEGRVSGNQLYLLILSGSRIDYTAILDRTKDGGLAGMAVSRLLADAPEARLADRSPIQLVRSRVP